jgi:hypothetical protein
MKYIVLNQQLKDQQLMDLTEKKLKLESLELALEDIDRIIENMKKKQYDQTELNEYVKKRWQIWNEIYQVRKS